MPFVNEEISEEEKARIDLRRHGIIYPSHWTIDKERGVYLIRVTLGHPDGLTPEYLLVWKGVAIRVFVKGEWESEPGVYVVTGIVIPPELLSKRAEIRTAVADAFLAHGWNYTGVGASSIQMVNC